MEHPGWHWNRFPRPRSHSTEGADRMERVGLFFDGNSGAPAFSLPQTKDGIEETRRKAAAFVDVQENSGEDRCENRPSRQAKGIAAGGVTHNLP